MSMITLQETFHALNHANQLVHSPADPPARARAVKRPRFLPRSYGLRILLSATSWVCSYSRGRDHPEAGVPPAVVVPVDSAGGGVLDVGRRPCRSTENLLQLQVLGEVEDERHVAEPGPRPDLGRFTV